MKRIVVLVLVSVSFLACLFVYDFFNFHDKKLHIIFCDVGQGDAILIKTPTDKVIVVDGGPDRKILTCLSKHLPFWQRKIDLLLLTHPHLDHFLGMYYLIDRYSITTFATEELGNDTASFKELLKRVADKKIYQKKVFASDVFRIGEVVIKIESPTTEFLHETSPGGLIGEKEEFASIIARVTFGEFSALLTGDSQKEGVIEAGRGESGVDVFQVPHHGSETGLNDEVLLLYRPKLAVISVGKKNRYGHPSKKVLDILAEYKILNKRTDQAGDIEIVSDGEKFWIPDSNH